MSEAKRVWVTGGSRGIGLACGRLFAEKGWHVALSARDEATTAEAVDSLLGEGHVGICGDLTETSGRQESLRRLEAWGRPDIVVQALGGVLARVGLNATEREWNDTFNLNFFSVVELNRVVIEWMRELGDGVIIHISSSAAVHGRATLPYCAAKAALNRYILNADRELRAHGVRIGGLMPAAVAGLDNCWARVEKEDPERYQRVREGQVGGRFQTPEEVAASVYQMACFPDECDYSQILNLDLSV